MKKIALAIACAVAAVCICGAQEGPHASQDNGAVQVQMHNVMYHFTDQVAAHLVNVGGTLVPTSPGHFPVFDDKESFELRLTAAEITMDPQSLAHVLNTHVFSGNDAPLKDISVSIENGLLKIKGKLHKKGDVGFETEGRLSATADGKIRLHAEKIRALHLPVKGLMDLFGVDIADLIKNGKVRGVQVEKDDLILDPGEDPSAAPDFRQDHRHTSGRQQHRADFWRSQKVSMDQGARAELHGLSWQPPAIRQTADVRH